MAPTLGNTVLEQVRIGRQVHLASDFLDGETEALRSDLPHNEDFCLFVCVYRARDGPGIRDIHK